MARLADAIANFSTGDVIITYHPSPSRRPLHFTLFLEARDSPTRAASFAHSMNGVEISPATMLLVEGENYMGEFMHAQYQDEQLRKAAAIAARNWAQTAVRTPYGSSPSSDSFVGQANLGLSRFRAMRATPQIASIPFDAAALLRAMKWTVRLMFGETLSVRRGITCAAFTGACYQAAALTAFFRNSGVTADKVRIAHNEFAKRFQDKSVMRDALPQVTTRPNDKGDTQSYGIGQALRENSNRPIKASTAAVLQQYRQMNLPFLKDAAGQPDASLQDLDLWWFLIQSAAGMNKYVVSKLSDVLPVDLQHDMKYISSNIFTELIEGSPRWLTVRYT